jgi:uncharacterized membrane protein HdeD (DUF308 family)
MTLLKFNLPWWVLALRGIAAIVFGLLTFLIPEVTLMFLLILFAGYCFLDGILTMVAALTRQRRSDARPRWWVLYLQGMASIGTGAIAIFWPAVTSIVLLYMIAAWAIVTGILSIITAVRLRKEMEEEWLMILAGALSVAFGLILAFSPVTGALVVVWWIGMYAIAFGAMMLFLAFRLRKREASGQLEGKWSTT